MTRRVHTKSRNGCVECKRRHIKCSEQRPCANCTKTGVECTFATKTKVTPQDINGARVRTPVGSSAGTPATGVDLHSPNSIAQAADGTGALSGGHFSLMHMKLLHHFSTVTFQTFSDDQAQHAVWQSTIVKLSLSFPWLLREILAIAALHISHSNPEAQKYWSTAAMELQNDALKEFGESQRVVDASNCTAVMIFASLLSLHMLADRSHADGLDHHEYLSHLLEWFNLARGAQIVVLGKWDAILAQSELEPLFQQEFPEPPYDIPSECHNLSNITKNADLGPASIEAYDAAIDRLFWNFALSKVPSEEHNTIQSVLAWPMQLKDNFLKLLNERRPEALIILAYYGVLLHFYRQNWAVGNAGVAVVRAVRAHTGPYWTPWLAWPERMVESDT